MAKTVVGIRFKKVGKIYYFDPKGLELEQYDHVIVETVRGMEYGEVALAPREIDDTSFTSPIKPVLRKATDKDEADFKMLKRKEVEARDVFIAKAKEHQLDMKLIDVEYTFDKKKAIFYFTAEGRVDFRELVKDLASVFKVRIELRQIGVRDEAKLFCGLGVCGRTTCCSQWLGDFTPVSIKMAKEQNLSLNSTKISGICGRLLCCLTYEAEFYEEITKKMPKVGKTVVTPDGEGEVFKLNVLEESVSVKIMTDAGEPEVRQYPLEAIHKKEIVSKPTEAESKKEKDVAKPAEMEAQTEEKDDKKEKADKPKRSRRRRSRSRKKSKAQRTESDNNKKENENK